MALYKRLKGTNFLATPVSSQYRPSLASAQHLHEISQEYTKTAIALLTEHLKRTGQASTIQIFHDRDIELLDNGRPAAFCTHANLALCYALLGDEKNAMKSLESVARECPDKQVIAEAYYEVATIYIAHDEFSTAKRLLYSTLGDGPAAWTERGYGPSKRLLTWVILSQLERRDGNQRAYDRTVAQIQSLMPSPYGYFIRETLSKMGLSAKH
jgi:hypothetical protein